MKRTPRKADPAFDTLCVQAGESAKTDLGAVVGPIHVSSTFAMEAPGRRGKFFYGRLGNPTRAALEECLAGLEGGARAFAVASGMAASAATLHLLGAGSRVIAPNDCYGGTRHLFEDIFTRQGYVFDFVDMRDPENVRRAATADTGMVWIETPSNPVLRIADIEAICAIARERGILAVADNTFATPRFQRPLDLGADVVIHSTTKYLNGHSDVVGGAVVCREAETGERIADIVAHLGSPCSPFDAWLVRRGIKTLPLRMARHAENAQAVAEFLEGRDEVERVHYPGLRSHPQHTLARRQMSGFGGVVSAELRGGREAAFRFVESLGLFAFAVSLGGVESLAEHPASMSHSSMSPEARAEAGVGEGLVRLSVGIEDTGDLLRDLGGAMAGLKK